MCFKYHLSILNYVEVHQNKKLSPNLFVFPQNTSQNNNNNVIDLIYDNNI